MTVPPADDAPLHARFDRLERLFGPQALEALMRLRVAVFGLGGVGSFAAEALARSAVGHLALIDFDVVCASNTNRQLAALADTVGQPKADVLCARLRQVNPAACIEGLRALYDPEHAASLLRPPWPGQDHFDFVVDCIDRISAKAHLLATCRERGLTVVSSMGAAGRIDPTRVRTADLADTYGCHLASDLRKLLRRRHGFPHEGPMGVPAVFSDELRITPRELPGVDEGPRPRSPVNGTVAYVTGAFGLACASLVVNAVTAPLRADARPAATPDEEAP